MNKQVFDFHKFDRASKSSVKYAGVFLGIFFGLLAAAGALITDSYGKTLLTSGNIFATITYWILVLLSILFFGFALFSGKHVTNTQVTISDHFILLESSRTRGEKYSLLDLHRVQIDYRKYSTRYSSHGLATLHLFYPGGQKIKLVQYPAFDEEIMLQEGDAHQLMLDLKKAIETRAAELQNIPVKEFEKRKQ